VRTRGLATVGVFILPPSASVLEQRLRGRSKDAEEEIRKRLEVACREVDEFVHYDYLVINDELHAAVDRLRAIVTSERARVTSMRDEADEVVRTFRKVCPAAGKE
jgi:guanylate kinase